MLPAYRVVEQPRWWSRHDHRTTLSREISNTSSTMRIVCTIDLRSLLSKSALLSSSHRSPTIHWEPHPQHLQPREHRDLSLLLSIGPYYTSGGPSSTATTQPPRLSQHLPCRRLCSPIGRVMGHSFLRRRPGPSRRPVLQPQISVQFKNSHSGSTDLCSRSSWMSYLTPHALMIS